MPESCEQHQAQLLSSFSMTRVSRAGTGQQPAICKFHKSQAEPKPQRKQDILEGPTGRDIACLVDEGAVA